MFWFRSRKKLNQALSAAILFKDVESVRKLLRRGADPNGIVDGYRERALSKAIRNNNLEIVNMLLAAGADPLEPFYFGDEMRLSDYARHIERSTEIIERIEAAEREAVEKFGPPRPLRKAVRVCRYNPKQ